MRWRWRRRCTYGGTHARCRLASILLAENYCYGSTSIISQTLSCRHFGGACYTCHSLQSLQALPKNASTAHTAHAAKSCFLEQRHTVEYILFHKPSVYSHHTSIVPAVIKAVIKKVNAYSIFRYYAHVAVATSRLSHPMDGQGSSIPSFL